MKKCSREQSWEVGGGAQRKEVEIMKKCSKQQIWEVGGGAQRKELVENEEV